MYRCAAFCFLKPLGDTVRFEIVLLRPANGAEVIVKEIYITFLATCIGFFRASSSCCSVSIHSTVTGRVTLQNTTNSRRQRTPLHENCATMMERPLHSLSGSLLTPSFRSVLRRLRSRGGAGPAWRTSSGASERKFASVSMLTMIRWKL